MVVDRIYDDAARDRGRHAASRSLVAEQFQQVHEESSDRILVIDKGAVIPDSELQGTGAGTEV